jgi:protein-tyrosine phosphatase
VDYFSIVFICTGNRFRSPLAEAFLHRLTLGLPVTVQSFGTLDVGQAPALAEAIELAIWSGVDLSSHRARWLGSELLGDVDLLLGFEPEHVRDSVVDADAPRSRSFTLRELVGLIEQVEAPSNTDVVARAQGVVARANELRDTAAPLSEITTRDPFGRSPTVYSETAQEIRELTIALAAHLFGVSDLRGLPAVPAKPLRRRMSLWRR